MLVTLNENTNLHVDDLKPVSKIKRKTGQPD